jgi:hypothetical protein
MTGLTEHAGGIAEVIARPGSPPMIGGFARGGP